MYDPTFGRTSLARQLNKSDFLNDPALRNPAHKAVVVAQAVAIAKNGFASLPLISNRIAGRTIFQVNDLASDLVLRKAAQNIRLITASKQGSRIEIIRRLKLFCEEGIPFTIAKMDIKNFYPSVDQDFLSTLLTKRLMTAPSTGSVITSLIDQCRNNLLSGLPPGLAISAELSEFYMQDFDRHVRKIANIHYFARYVDDMVVVLPIQKDKNEIRKIIESFLPNGLSLNFSKSKTYNFSSTNIKYPSIEHAFDYLGFKFNVYQANSKNPMIRKVHLDIASSKVKKNKTRIVKSFLQYLSDGKFEDLKDRLRILTCGYQFFDERQKKLRSVGLQHTYSLIENDAPALINLDKFLTGMILCNSGPISGRLALIMTNRERKELLKLSFFTGFNNHVHFRFGASRLAHLIGCWKYA
ncbi:antiviral reverse transcriptase Drt3a [Gluconobacter sphaericus]|uniref:antiviral reverse transcriptase Drt3a n=1 Tax=Gluconobacter sphaericus TaxID=574987 RepID=UPI001B8B50DE|nr:antiviral reverse transcriptase Drt3a [Gluconobacter sphaericus]MBS1087306.1 RNA-directed DNA polymerase [Gluconobacter sphaericus]MBS1101351.1 RNA-directed DNA polymerase [Gluconobacter sphaericus]